MEWYRDTSGMNCRFCADANIRFKELDRNTGTPRYLCRVCGRSFQWSHCRTPPPCFAGETGPFPHLKTFNLNGAASRSLRSLCAAKGMSPVQAIRFVLREEAVARAVFAVHTGGRLLRSRRQAEPEDLPAPEVLAEPLADGRPVSSRAMRAQSKAIHKQGNLATVGVVERVRVCMDDRAKAGLLRAMAKYGANHQETLRQLLADGARWGRW